MDKIPHLRDFNATDLNRCLTQGPGPAPWSRQSPARERTSGADDSWIASTPTCRPPAPPGTFVSPVRPRSRPYDPGVIPLVLAIAGVPAIGMAFAILRGFGPGSRSPAPGSRRGAASPGDPDGDGRRVGLRSRRRAHRQRARVRGRAPSTAGPARPSLRWRPATGAGGRGRSLTAGSHRGPRVDTSVRRQRRASTTSRSTARRSPKA